MGARAIRDADMATAHSLIERIRRELDPVEQDMARRALLLLRRRHDRAGDRPYSLALVPITNSSTA